MFPRSNIKLEKVLVLSLLGLLCLSPLYQGGSPYPVLTVLRLGILLVTTGIIFLLFRSETLEIPKTGIYVFVLIFSIFVIGSTFASDYKNISVEWLLSYIMYLLFFGATLFLFSKRDLIFKGLTVLFLFSVFEAGWGLVQYFFLDFDRSKGTFFNPNYFAGFLIPASIVGLSCLWFPVKDRNITHVFNVNLKFSRYIKPLITAGVGLMALGIFLSGSRGAVLSFLVAAGTLMVARFKIRGMIAIALVFAAFFIIPNPALERFRTSPWEDVTAYSRIDIWENSVQMAMDHPIGIGLGMFKYYWPQYNFPVENALTRYGRWSQTPHNEYLQIGVELGIGALIAFLGGIWIFMKDARMMLRKEVLGAFQPILWGLICGLIGVLIQAFGDSNLHEPSIGLQFAFICGLILCIKKVVFPEKVYRFRLTNFPHEITPFYRISVWVIAILVSVVLLRPLVAYGYSVMGSRYLAEGKIDRSVRYLDLATWWAPGKTQYHSLLAAALFKKYLDTNDVEWVNDSTFELNYANYLNSRNEAFPRQLGYVYSVIALRTKEAEIKEYLYSLSLSYYKKAIRLNPYQANNYQELGKIYHQMGDVQSAEIAFRRAVSLEPHFLPAHLSLGDIYIQKGDIRKAQKQYMRILSTLKIYSTVTKLTPLEKQYLNIDPEKMRLFSRNLKERL